MEYNKLLKEKEYLIKSAIKKLNIYKNYDEFYHLGTIALYNAYVKYDETKDKYKNFDIYAYYVIINNLKNELTKMNKYTKLEMQIDLYNNTYLAPIIEDGLLEQLEFEDLLRNLSDIQNKIINYRRLGYRNDEIAKVLNLTNEQIKYQLKLVFNQVRNNINKINVN